MKAVDEFLDKVLFESHANPIPLGDAERLPFIRGYMSRGMKLNEDVSVNGRHALSSIAASGRTDWIAPMVLAGAMVDLVEADGKTPIELAIRASNVPTVFELIRCGSKVKEVTVGKDESLLQLTCDSLMSPEHKVRLAQLFLDAGIDPNARSEGRYAAVHSAAPSESLLRVLEAGGANLNLQGGAQAYTVGHIAASQGYRSSFAFLLQAGVDLGIEDANQVSVWQTALLEKSGVRDLALAWRASQEASRLVQEIGEPAQSPSGA